MQDCEDRTRELQIDLACMAWAKRQRERQVRQALRVSREMRLSDDLDRLILANRVEQRRQQRSRVIGEEVATPLVCSDADLQRLLAEEDRQRTRYLKVAVSLISNPFPLFLAPLTAPAEH